MLPLKTCTIDKKNPQSALNSAFLVFTNGLNLLV